jgi:hypothetical protein
MEQIAHGNPQPKKTFTAFDPLIFPTASSALSDYLAAVILAKVSGSDVPRATTVMAATDSLIPMQQPKTVATSPTINVISPIYANDITKQGAPAP